MTRDGIDATTSEEESATKYKTHCRDNMAHLDKK